MQSRKEIMPETEAKRKENMKFLTRYMAVIFGIVGGYFFSYLGGLAKREHLPWSSCIGEVVIRLSKWKIWPPLNMGTLSGLVFGGIGTALVVWFLVSVDNQKHYHHREDAVSGTGGFMEQKDLNAYRKTHLTEEPGPVLAGLPVPYDPETDAKRYSQTIILSKHFGRPVNSRALIGNNNVLIVGGAGTGKSRFVIKPNVLQMNASYVISDPSGEMIYSLGSVLQEHGYRIKIFNLSDMSHSNCYNPLAYIRDEAGVKMLIECLISNTTKGEGGGDNQFFVDAEQLLYSACIFYLKEFSTNESHKNFAGILTMINASSINENNPNEKSPLDQLFDALPHDSLAWKYYRSFKQAAGKTLKSIIISCVTRLQPFLIPQVVNLTKTDTLHLERLGEEKTALFIITPQADRTYSFLSSMLYHQLFETLYFVAEQQKVRTGNERLKIPVSCLMDEFANSGEVPEFPSRLATMRKYNISATIVLQNISQIEAMYQDHWKTLVGNCSTILFLGSQEPEVLKYFSEMLGKMTIRVRSEGLSNGGKGGSSQNYQSTGREVMTADELGRLPSNQCIVFTQNMRPVLDEKYVYESHPYYGQTADCREERGFRYQEYPVFDIARNRKVESLLRAGAEAARYRKEEEEKRLAKDLNEKRGTGNLYEEMNKLSFGTEEDEKRYRKLLETALQQGAKQKEDAVCFLCVEDIQPKYLVSMAEELSARLQKSMLVLFTCPKDNEEAKVPYIGVGIDQDREGLAQAMKGEPVQKLGVKKGIIYAAVGAEDYAVYREKVMEKMKENRKRNSKS